MTQARSIMLCTLSVGERVYGSGAARQVSPSFGFPRLVADMKPAEGRRHTQGVMMGVSISLVTGAHLFNVLCQFCDYYHHPATPSLLAYKL